MAMLGLLWCGAILAHFDDRMHWEVAIVITAACVAALAGMLLARSWVVMLAACVLQILAAWRLMPGIDNHWFFAGVVSLAWIGALLTVAAKRRGRPGPLGDETYAVLAPVLRWLIIVMYAFAVFHKLNWGFLDPETSCAVHFYHRASRTPLVPNLLPTELPDAWGQIVVWGILAAEAIIPVLLLGRRTWFLGLAVGVCFHLTTGLFMRHYPSIMFALYWVFVPDNVQRDLVARISGRLRALTRGRVGVVAALVGGTVALSIATYFVHRHLQAMDWPKRHPDGGYYPVVRVWNGLVVLAAAAVAVTLLRMRALKTVERGRMRVKAWWLHGIVVAFGVNCMSPYLGLKTSTSIAMWSNLITTGGVSNHVLIPAGTFEVYRYASDVVRVHSANDKKLRRFARRDELLPWYDFRRQVRAAIRRAKKQGKTVRFTYERGGQVVRVRDAAQHREFRYRLGYWDRKFVKIKRVRADYRAKCVW